jgi:hypothetical protein
MANSWSVPSHEVSIATSRLVDFANGLSAEVEEHRQQVKRIGGLLHIPEDNEGGFLLSEDMTDMERLNFSLGVLSGQRQFLNSLMAFLITWSNDAAGKLQHPPEG